MVNKEWYIHTVDYHSAIRKTNYCQIQQPGWTSNACAQNSPIQRASVYDILVKAEPQGQKTLSVVSRDWGLRRIWLQRAGGYPWADGSLLYFDHNSMHFSKLTESYTRKVQFYCLQIPSNKKNLHEPEEGPWGLASSAQLPQTLSQAPLFSHFCRVPPSAEGRRERLGRQSWAPPLGRGGSSTAAAPAVWLHHPCWFPCKWYLH